MKQARSRKRPSSPSPVKQVRRPSRFTELALYVRAGGRCEFNGCNQLLIEHPLTLSLGNFAEKAHIVAFSKGGPRGHDGSRPADINVLAT